MDRWVHRESMVTGDHEVHQVLTVNEESEGDLAVMASLVLTAVMERRDQTAPPGLGVCRGYKECREREDTEAGPASQERKDSWVLSVLKERRGNTDRWAREVPLVLQALEEREAGMELLDLLE